MSIMPMVGIPVGASIPWFGEMATPKVPLPSNFRISNDTSIIINQTSSMNRHRTMKQPIDSRVCVGGGKSGGVDGYFDGYADTGSHIRYNTFMYNKRNVPSFITFDDINVYVRLKGTVSSPGVYRTTTSCTGINGYTWVRNGYSSSTIDDHFDYMNTNGSSYHYTPRFTRRSKLEYLNWSHVHSFTPINHRHTLEGDPLISVPYDIDVTYPKTPSSTTTFEYEVYPASIKMMWITRIY